MKTKFLLLFIILILALTQTIYCYSKNSDDIYYLKRPFFDMASDFSVVSAFGHNKALLGFCNPANSIISQKLKKEFVSFFWSDDERKQNDYNNWAIFASSTGGMFLGVVKENYKNDYIYNAKVGLAQGKNGLQLGVGYGWSDGNNNFERIDDAYWDFGVIYDTNSYITAGGNILIENYSDYKEETYFVSVKPILNYDFYLAYEHNYQSSAYIRQLRESYVASISFFKYFKLDARFYGQDEYIFGLTIQLNDELEIMANSCLDNKRKTANNIYGVGIIS